MVIFTVVIFLTWFTGAKTNRAESKTGSDVWLITGLTVGAILFILGISLIVIACKR